MARYLGLRLLGSLATVWVALTVVFLALNAVPGDPTRAALGDSTVSKAVIERRREAFGLNLPLWLRYARFMSGIARGDWGISWASGQPVIIVVVAQFEPTLELAGMGWLIALATGFGLGLGTINRHLRVLIKALTSMLAGTPAVVVGTVLIWVVSIQLGWLPATGQGSFQQVILPALTVGITAGGGLAQIVESGIQDVLRQPFVRYAVAKGLPPARVLWRHIVRVGILPAVELSTIQLSYLLGGTVVTETLFARSGVGRLLAASVLAQDLPVVEAIIAAAILVYLVLHVLADVLAGWLDPRISATS